MDPTVQSWLEQGVSPAQINSILEVVPYTSQVPEIAGDFESMAIIAADPDFQQYKDDPAFWQRLRENLAKEPAYNQGLPPAQQGYQEPLSYPDLFSTWGNTAQVHPFYQQDQRALGRMLAEVGGDFDFGPRY
jgi:hypothetical protein